MSTVYVSRARAESVRSIVPATHKRKGFIRKAWESANCFFERNRASKAMLALGTLATAYGVARGYSGTEALSDQLQTLGSNFINTQTAPHETHITDALWDISQGAGSTVTGATLLIGAVAHNKRPALVPEDVLHAGLFIPEQPLVEDRRELIPEQVTHEPGLYVIRGGATEQPAASAHVPLHNLLAQAA